MGMKFTNNRKKAVNLSAKSSGRYNWENASVVFEKEIRKYNKIEGSAKIAQPGLEQRQTEKQ